MTEQSTDTGRSVHEQMHLAALAACATKKDKIRYACEQLGNPGTAEVIAWLARYGENTSRPSTSTVVNEWKRERDLPDTGTLPKLTNDVLAELDRTVRRPGTDANGTAPNTHPVSDTDRTNTANTVPADTAVFVADTAVLPDSSDSRSELAEPVTGHHPGETGHPARPASAAVVSEPRSPLPRADTEHSADSPPEQIQGSEHMSVAVADTGLGAATVASEHGADAFATRPLPVSPMPTAAVTVEAVVPPARETPPGAIAFYIVSVMSLLVSLDTSWLFFRDELHIENVWIRGGMFAVLEAALIACGVGMAAGVRRHGTPGSAQISAWALCGLSGYMAVVVAGPVDGLARVGLGPVLGMLMFHHALGIEKRARQNRSGVWARLGRELRERVLSRLGLADDERDAARRTRDRAARRVAQLSLGRRVLFRQSRLARALAAAGVAHDEAMRTVMLAELATRRHAGALATLPQPSPWTEHRTV